MTKDYHLTPEQTLRIWEDTIRNLKGDEDIYQAFVNAALDRVLGEPVGGICLKGQNDYPMATFNTTDLPVGTILYAPKELT